MKTALLVACWVLGVLGVSALRVDVTNLVKARVAALKAKYIKENISSYGFPSMELMGGVLLNNASLADLTTIVQTGPAYLETLDPQTLRIEANVGFTTLVITVGALTVSGASTPATVKIADNKITAIYKLKLTADSCGFESESTAFEVGSVTLVNGPDPNGPGVDVTALAKPSFAAIGASDEFKSMFTLFEPCSSDSITINFIP